MPSALAIRRRRYLDPRGTGSRSRLAALTSNKQVQIGPPWGGYTPDLGASITNLNDFENVRGFMPVSGEVTHPPGWDQYRSADLPLNGSGAAEAVVGIISYTTVGIGTRVQLVVTHDRLYLDDGTNFTLIAFTGTAGFEINANADITAANLVDWAYFPPSNSVIFCNGGVDNGSDPVYEYPEAAAYHDFNEGGTVFGGATVRFEAQSVEAVEGRLVFLNTTEDTTDTSNRVRWTSIGASPVLDEATTGTGFIDLNELSVGLRVENLGPVVACYFRDGVAFLRRTGLATEAFRRDYVSHHRGLLGTQAVTSIGRGLHFGIFEDGWFLLNSAGHWQEVGLRNVGGTFQTKWRDNFYGRLNKENQTRIAVHFDETTRTVRIAAPMEDSTANSEVWVYHIDTDTVWPDIYGTDSNGADMTPNCWGSLDLNTAVAWGDMTGSWGSYGPSPWFSFADQVDRPAPTHGTVSGMVFRHNLGTITRDDQVPTYLLESHAHPLGNHSQLKTLDKLHLSYARTAAVGGGDPPPVQVDLISPGEDGRTDTFQLEQTKGTLGTEQIDFVSTRLPGNRLKYRLSGTAPVRVLGMEMEFDYEGSQELGEDVG